MLTLSQLQKAAKIKRSYSENVPTFMDHDACKSDGPANRSRMATLTEASSDDDPKNYLTVEYDADAKEYICR